jgi:DNA-binding IclR family transcriptional regulator
MEQFQEHQSFGITDLARRTELLPSDVHRLLASLRVCGYVEQDPETRKYRLGFALIRLAVFQWDQLCDKAHPVLVRLSQKVSAATRLALLDGRETKVFLVDQVKGPNAPAFGDHLGGSAPLHCTALGKTIIANLNEDVAFSALEKSGLTKYTRSTITNRSILRQQFQEFRRLGYAVDREEYMNGVCCLASPLRNSAGSVVGAISTSMLSSQFTAWDESRLGAHLKNAAVQVAATLGASRPT